MIMKQMVIPRNTSNARDRSRATGIGRLGLGVGAEATAYRGVEGPPAYRSGQVPGEIHTAAHRLRRYRAVFSPIDRHAEQLSEEAVFGSCS